MLLLQSSMAPEVQRITVDGVDQGVSAFAPGEQGRVPLGVPSLDGGTMAALTRIDTPGGDGMQKTYLLVFFDLVSGAFESVTLERSNALGGIPALTEDGGAYLIELEFGPGMLQHWLTRIGPERSLEWSVPFGEPTPPADLDGLPASGSQPIETRSGDLIAATARGEYVSIRPDGTVRWVVQRPDSKVSGPILGEGDEVLTDSREGNLLAVSSDGQPLWRASLSAEPDPELVDLFSTTLTLVEHDHLIVARHPGELAVLDAHSGTVVYGFVTPFETDVIPCLLVSDSGLLMIAGTDGLHAFHGPYRFLAASAWPKIFADLGNRNARAEVP